MECKLTHAISADINNRIEVEPYWNVNLFKVDTPVPTETIEVEPYWNVNVAGALGYSIEDTIEVEPYWNVNSSGSKA